MIRSPISIFVLLAIILFTGCAQKQDIETLIKSIPDASIKAIADNDSTRESYEIIIKQRLDHFGNDTTTFNQKIHLSHIDFSKPVVVVTSGYSANENIIYEPTDILNANQIIIEHRYFGESVPKNLDWKYLNIKQAAADHHQIVQLLKKFYKGKWLSTGISKGGQTALFYKYFYPSDVDATIAYVAPINFSKADPRILDFLKHVGSDSCRQKIFKFQKILLENKAKVLPKFEEFSKINGLFYKMGYEAAYEYCVLEFSFAFWQWGDLPCDSIPLNPKDPDKIFSAFKQVGFTFFSEEEIESIRPFFVQALTEIGFYTYDNKPFDNLIKKTRNPDFSFTLPEGVDTTYNYSSMKEVNDFLQNKGNNIIYIYGENDPWSASSVQMIPGKTNSIKMIKQGGDHETRIKDLESVDKKQIYKALRTWMDCQINERL